MRGGFKIRILRRSNYQNIVNDFYARRQLIRDQAFIGKKHRGLTIQYGNVLQRQLHLYLLIRAEHSRRAIQLLGQCHTGEGKVIAQAFVHNIGLAGGFGYWQGQLKIALTRNTHLLAYQPLGMGTQTHQAIRALLG